jgi:hypothetical protein
MQPGCDDAERLMISILRVDKGGPFRGIFFSHNVRAAPSSGIILNG